MERVQKRYVSELKTNKELVHRLKTEAQKGTITLLFAAKDIEHNNAVVLRNFIEK